METVKLQIATYESFPEGMCDAHTIGLHKYGHPEIQIVLHLKDDVIQTIVEQMGKRFAQNSIIILENVKVYGILTDDWPIRLNYIDGYWRLILPDPKGRMPEDSDIEPFCRQMQPLPIPTD